MNTSGFCLQNSLSHITTHRPQASLKDPRPNNALHWIRSPATETSVPLAHLAAGGGAGASGGGTAGTAGTGAGAQGWSGRHRQNLLERNGRAFQPSLKKYPLMYVCRFFCVVLVVFQWRWLFIPWFVHRESRVIGSCSVQKHSRSQRQGTFHLFIQYQQPSLPITASMTSPRPEMARHALQVWSHWQCVVVVMAEGEVMLPPPQQQQQEEEEEEETTQAQAQAQAMNHNTIWSTFTSTPFRHLEGERPSARFRTEKCPSSSFLQEREKSPVQWKLGPKPKPELNHVFYHLI